MLSPFPGDANTTLECKRRETLMYRSFPWDRTSRHVQRPDGAEHDSTE
jgi:hypothetical protein